MLQHNIIRFLTDGPPGFSNPIRLPKGTRAIVNQWPKEYLNALETPPTDNQTVWVKVRILNGPLREEILYVDSRAVELP